MVNIPHLLGLKSTAVALFFKNTYCRRARTSAGIYLLLRHREFIDLWDLGVVWYTVLWLTRRFLQRVINTDQRIIKSQLPEMEDMYSSHCLWKASNIIKDPSHPCHHLFAMLPSGKYYQTSRAHNSRLLNSFNLKAFTTLNIA